MFRYIKKAIAITVLVAFIITSINSPVYAQSNPQGMFPCLPMPGVMVHLSPEFIPAHLLGMTIHPDNALQFDFLIHKGDQYLDGDQKKEEYQKLVKYFLASLTIPDEDQWVNLSPYEKDRIIKDDFGKTEMGRDLLAQDYLLKQITSSLIYPEEGLGKKFWDKIYERAWREYHTTDIPVNTFNKVWIVPDQALVYESANSAYILQSHLKVMLEEDYLSLEKHTSISYVIPAKAGIQPNDAALNAKAPQGNNPSTNKLGSQVIREIILPELEKEVNEGKNFANLRQMFSGMVLATWYKKALKESLLGKVYADKAKVQGVTGITSADPGVIASEAKQSQQQIYQRYLKAFKKGVFNYIKEDVDKYTNEAIPRKYFSGGFSRRTSTRNGLDAAMKVVKTIPVDFKIDESEWPMPFLINNKNGASPSIDEVGIKLQIPPIPTQPPGDDSSKDKDNAMSSEQQTVVVVDDYPGTLYSHYLLLRDQGYKVLTAASQKEFEQIMKKHWAHVGLLIADTYGDWPSIIQRILIDVNYNFGPVSDIPIITLNPIGNDKESVRGYLRPIASFQKPYNNDQFLAAVAQVKHISPARIPKKKLEILKVPRKAINQLMNEGSFKFLHKLMPQTPTDQSDPFPIVADYLKKLGIPFSSVANSGLSLKNVQKLVYQVLGKGLNLRIKRTPDLADKLAGIISIYYGLDKAMLQTLEPVQSIQSTEDEFDKNRTVELPGLRTTKGLFETTLQKMMAVMKKPYIYSYLNSRWATITASNFSNEEKQVAWQISRILATRILAEKMKLEILELKSDYKFKIDDFANGEIGALNLIYLIQESMQKIDPKFKINDTSDPLDRLNTVIIDPSFWKLLGRETGKKINNREDARVELENEYHAPKRTQGFIQVQLKERFFSSESPNTAARLNILTSEDLLGIITKMQKSLERPSSNPAAPIVFNMEGNRTDLAMNVKTALLVAATGAAVVHGILHKPSIPIIQDSYRNMSDAPGQIQTVDGIGYIITTPDQELIKTGVLAPKDFRSVETLIKEFPVGSGATFNFFSDGIHREAERDYSTYLQSRGEIVVDRDLLLPEVPYNMIFTSNRFVLDVGAVHHEYSLTPRDGLLQLANKYNTAEIPKTRTYVSPIYHSKTMISPTGGIDFNAANLNLQIKRDGRGVPLPLAQQDMAQLNSIQGFVPQIIEIKPAVNVPIINELQQKLQSSLPAMANPS